MTGRMMKRGDVCFNSIKVQLERSSNSSSFRPPVFQFHKGAIRTRWSALVDTPRCFNSIKVQLELG